ncbi:IclR family transcriptional regulator [Parapusillimonas sp. SGNA-6]|nr:IclR family transcriptional regulator [Parapusillimonas sp. SGNA-6]
MTSDTNPLNVKSLEKAFAILEAFQDQGRFMALGELSTATGLGKSATQRFAYTLKKLGYLEQDPTTRRYALGKKLLGLTFQFLRTDPLIDKAAPILTELRRSLGERVDLSLLDGNSLVYVMRMRTKRESLSHAHIGCSVPLYCSAGGRSVLACLPDEEAEQLIASCDLVARTPHTKVTPADIMEDVRKVRSNGYAIQSGEWRLDEIVIAAAITDRQGRPVGAVHVAASASEWNEPDFIKHVVPQLLPVVRGLSGQQQ